MQAGDVYAIDLAKVWSKIDRTLKGKYALGWCTGPVDVSWMAQPTPHVKVVLADKLFDKPPTKIPQLRARTFIHRVPNVYPALSCIPDEPLPRGVARLGSITKLPPVEEYVLIGSWTGLVMDLHYSWLDEHAPPPKPAPPLKPRKPRKVDPKRLLPEWTGLVKAKHAKAVRDLLREALATKPTKPRLRKLVDAINDYNEANGSFIDTAEREALMQTLEDIAAANGLGMMTKQLDAWRDW